MIQLSRFSVAQRIGGLPVLAASAFVVSFAVNLVADLRGQAMLERIQTSYYPSVALSRDLEEMLTQIQRRLQDAVAANNIDDLKESDALKSAFLSRLTAGETNSVIPRERLRSLRARFGDYYDRARDLSSRLIGGETGEGIVASMRVMQSRFSELRDSLAENTRLDQEAIATVFEGARRLQRLSLLSGAAIKLTSLLILVWLSTILARDLSAGLGQAVEAAARLASGDLAARIDVRSDDEIGRLGLTFNRMAEDLGRAGAARELQAAALSAAANTIAITDANGRIEYVNPAFTEMTGYSAAEAVGNTFRVLKSGQHDSAFYQTLWRAVRSGQVWRGELVNRRKDGTSYPEYMTITPLLDQKGIIERFIAIKEDITERKRTEQGILQEKAFSEALLDSLPGAFSLFDHAGKLRRWNRSMETVLGYSPEEMATMRASDLIAGEDRALCENMIRMVFETGAGAAEMGFLSKDGSRLPHQFVAVHVVVDGAPHFICTAIDIAARKLADKALRASLDEQKALLKEVHHRVKNNLQVIASLLRIEGGRIDHAITKSVLGQMQGRIQSMALLHETLYRSGNFAQVDLASYVGELGRQLFRALATRPGAVRLNLDLAPVHAEIDQAIPCGLIVNELVSNSFKHGFAGDRTGEMWIRLRRTDDGMNVALSVSDNGAGLPQDFDLKQQRSLGLQLVSDLARQLQGSLRVGPGPEAVFEVTFVVTRTSEISRSV